MDWWAESSAPIAGENRAVQIDTAQASGPENLGREDLTIGGRDQEIGPERPHQRDAIGRVDVLRLLDAHASIECLPDLVAHGYEPSTIARWG